MQIQTYQEKYKEEIINLILNIQNNESKVNLSIDDQPDLCDINKYYIENDGNFWIATDNNDNVIGTLALMKEDNYAILKKIFIEPQHRGNGLSEKLFEQFIKHCKAKNIQAIILDTPSVCKRAHSFYIKHNFKQITKEQLPIKYNYADRNSIYFIKTI
ncbi:MAG: GNAT family N-acetyltransferase [Candidatus Gastranaerophilales bacterium]|nr:GNAT family N-acetyltransferase [Candidatus Gastranaerophilales bacterium]